MSKRRKKIPLAVKKGVRCPLCFAEFDRKAIPSRGERAEAFFCHFCRIAIMTNDPFVGRWEEAYASGEKVFCPACDTEMRCFCTSTGYMLFQCPVKKCRARMELSNPDRGKTPAPVLFDESGEPIELPNVNEAISTPDQPAITQVMGDGVDPALPKSMTVKLIQ